MLSFLNMVSFIFCHVYITRGFISKLSQEKEQHFYSVSAVLADRSTQCRQL